MANAQKDYFLKDKISGRFIYENLSYSLTHKEKAAIEEISKNFNKEENIIKNDFFEYLAKLESDRDFCRGEENLHASLFIIPGTTTTPTATKKSAEELHQNLLKYLELGNKYKKLTKILKKYLTLPTPWMVWDKKCDEKRAALNAISYGLARARREAQNELDIVLNTEPGRTIVDTINNCLDHYQTKSSIQKRAFENLIDLSSWEEKIEDLDNKLYQNDSFVLAMAKEDRIVYMGPDGYFDSDLNTALSFSSKEKAKRSASARGYPNYLLIKTNIKAVEIVAVEGTQPANNMLQAIIEKKNIEKAFSEFSVEEIKAEMVRREKNISIKKNKI